MPITSGKPSPAQEAAAKAYCAMELGAIDREDVVQSSRDPSKSFSVKVAYPGISKAACAVFVDLVTDPTTKAPLKDAIGGEFTEFGKLLCEIGAGGESPAVQKQLLEDIQYTLKSILGTNTQLDPQSKKLYEDNLADVGRALGSLPLFVQSSVKRLPGLAAAYPTVGGVVPPQSPSTPPPNPPPLVGSTPAENPSMNCDADTSGGADLQPPDPAAHSNLMRLAGESLPSDAFFRFQRQVG
ncbi:MAG: hypothetical protein ACK4FF_11355 [Limnobacter sp.]|uniref:hypothetical protein n=1 Tax=Limnobacter sp. TaxID=2003368 RepID=UPI00391C1BE4